VAVASALARAAPRLPPAAASRFESLALGGAFVVLLFLLAAI
jgi:hypothetical protein